NMNRLSALSQRWIEIAKGPETHRLRRGARHALRLDTQAATEIAPRERVILVIGRWVQKSSGVRALVPLNDEIRPAYDLGRPYLCGLAVESFHGADNAEDAVSLVLAGTRANA